MFLPYRSIGYVVDRVPPVIQKRGNHHFITASIGRSWHIFKSSTLRTRLISPEREGLIGALANTNDFTFTALGREVIVWSSVNEIARLCPTEGGRIIRLMTIGDILLTLSVDGHIYSWDFSGFKQKIAMIQRDDALMRELSLKNAVWNSSSTKKYDTTTVHDVMDDGQEDISGQLSGIALTEREQNLFNQSTKHDELSITPSSHCHIQPSFELRSAVSAPTVTVDTGLSTSTIVQAQDEPYITSWLHPHTYNNKIVIGWSTGHIELYNIRTGKLLHRFDSIEKAPAHDANMTHDDNDQDDDYRLTHVEEAMQKVAFPAISTLANSPALDVIAVGRQNGDIFLLHLALDTIIHRYHQFGRSSITAITFRSDSTTSGTAPQQMVTANARGGLTVWDLESKRSIFSFSAHKGAITMAYFFPGQPILMTAGADNALVQWFFDGTQLRELRSQRGHLHPPRHIKWLSFQEIISAGGDGALRYWSPTRDRSAREFSWGLIANNAHRSTKGAQNGFLRNDQRQVCGIDIAQHSVPSIGNIVTLNDNRASSVTIWSTENGRAERLIGAQDFIAASTTCFSYCGKFIWIGYKNGEVKKYSAQTSILMSSLDAGRVLTTSHADDPIIEQLKMTKSKKRRIRDQITKSQAVVVSSTSTGGVLPHTGGVLSMYCSIGNEYVVTVGHDGVIHTWDIHHNAKIGTFSLNKPIAYTSYSVEHGLLVVVTLNNDIFIIDTSRLVIVRQWLQLACRVSKVLLHSSLGLLFVADVLGGLRSYDVATGLLLDHTVFSRPVLSLDVCSSELDSRSTGDLIATTHAGSVGIYLWVLNPNRQVQSTYLMQQKVNLLGANSNALLDNAAFAPSHKVNISAGNAELQIDAEVLAKEHAAYEKEQIELYKKVRHDLDEQLEEDILDTVEEDDDDNEDDTTQQHTSHISQQERELYKKLQKSNHFLTVSIVQQCFGQSTRQMDAIITKPSLDQPLPPDEDEDNEEQEDIQTKTETETSPTDKNQKQSSSSTKNASQTTSKPTITRRILARQYALLRRVVLKRLDNNTINAQLSMLSGVNASRWKLLNQQQALAQRNARMKEAQLKVAEDAPFFLNIDVGTHRRGDATYRVQEGSSLDDQMKAISSMKNSAFTLWGYNAEHADGNALLSICESLPSIKHITQYVFDEMEQKHIEEDLETKAASERAIEEARLQGKNKKGQQKAAQQAIQQIQAQHSITSTSSALALQHDREHDVSALLSILYTKKLPTCAPESFIASHFAENSNPTTNLFANIPSSSQYASKSHEEVRTSLLHVDEKEKQRVYLEFYLQYLLQLRQELHISPTRDAKRVSDQLVGYILSTPPSHLSAEIGALLRTKKDNATKPTKSLTESAELVLNDDDNNDEDETGQERATARQLYVLLHALYIMAKDARGGVLDATNAVTQQVLQEHSVTISQHFLLRQITKLLSLQLSQQWNSLESLLQSNLAVINQLCGLTHGF